MPKRAKRCAASSRLNIDHSMTSGTSRPKSTKANGAQSTLSSSSSSTASSSTSSLGTIIETSSADSAASITTESLSDEKIKTPVRIHSSTKATACSTSVTMDPVFSDEKFNTPVRTDSSAEATTSYYTTSGSTKSSAAASSSSLDTTILGSVAKSKDYNDTKSSASFTSDWDSDFQDLTYHNVGGLKERSGNGRVTRRSA